MTEEASQIELEALTGGIPPEAAIAFLEEHGHYNEAILSQVSAARAFKYLQETRAHPKKVNEYAEKALTENPDNFEAKMKLMLSEKDNAKAAAGYREILAKDPNHVGVLLNLGGRIHFDDPEGALEHFTKANKLDPTDGLSGIGRVYERLGDVKTAWLYYISVYIICYTAILKMLRIPKLDLNCKKFSNFIKIYNNSCIFFN